MGEEKKGVSPATKEMMDKILKALSEGSKTYTTLREQVGVDEDSKTNWLTALVLLRWKKQIRKEGSGKNAVFSLIQ